MITSLTFLPQPPIIVDGVAGSASSELDDLRNTCRRAIELGTARARAIALLGTPDGLHVGRWLLGQVGVGLDVPEFAVEPTADLVRCRALGRELASASPNATAVVVMGDGSACRSVKAPGYLDDRSFGFDAAVANALAQADIRALLALDPKLATELLVAGRPAWQVAAAAVEAEGGSWEGELLAGEEPYGVMYFVANWRRHDFTG